MNQRESTLISDKLEGAKNTSACLQAPEVWQPIGKELVA